MCLSKPLKRAMNSTATLISLLPMCILGGQIKLDVTRTMKTSSAFCNKIWQAARFLLLARERKPEFQPTKIQLQKETPIGSVSALRWMKSWCSPLVLTTCDSPKNSSSSVTSRPLYVTHHVKARSKRIAAYCVFFLKLP